MTSSACHDDSIGAILQLVPCVSTPAKPPLVPELTAMSPSWNAMGEQQLAGIVNPGVQALPMRSHGTNALCGLAKNAEDTALLAAFFIVQVRQSHNALLVATVTSSKSAPG